MGTISWHCASTQASGGRACCRKPKIAHLAFGPEPRHRAASLVDGHAPVNAVLVVEVDGIDSEPLQAGLAGLPDVFRSAVDSDESALGVAHVTELGRQDDFLAAAADRLADQLFVAAPAVNIGRIQEIHAQVQSSVDDLDRLLIDSMPVEFRHAHAAEPQGRYALVAVAQFAVLHRFSSPKFAVFNCGASAPLSGAEPAVENSDSLASYNCLILDRPRGFHGLEHA